LNKRRDISKWVVKQIKNKVGGEYEKINKEDAHKYDYDYFKILNLIIIIINFVYKNRKKNKETND